MRVALGSDHRGFRAKQDVARLLAGLGHSVQDAGCYDESSVDYPDIASKVGQAVASGECQRGILLCSTGIGMSMAANKVKGVRAGLCHDVFTARRSREHNDANVLCFGVDVVAAETIGGIVAAFLNTAFEGGRHARRVEKMRDLECSVFP